MKFPAFLVVLLLAGHAAAEGSLEGTLQGLKDAVASKNTTQVKKLAIEAFPLVSEALAEPAPREAGAKPAWDSRIAYAKSVQSYAEYALFATAVASPPATLVDLIATLERQNPKSSYLDAAYGPYLVALNQTGAASKTTAVTEKALANFPQNEDLLLVALDATASRKQNDRALTYANRLVAALSKHPKPEGMTAAQWERKRNAGLGRGYWVAGVIYGERGQYQAADKNLRAALPLIQGDAAMLGPALFHLGMANYHLGKMTLSKARVLEGSRFSEQCAAISGPYTEQARHNALVMKAEAAQMR